MFNCFPETNCIIVKLIASSFWVKIKIETVEYKFPQYIDICLKPNNYIISNIHKYKLGINKKQ